MALESESSGSSMAKQIPALMHESLPITGVSIPPFDPISSSRSIPSTIIQLDF